MTINNDTASATITVMDDSTNGPLEFNITAYDKTGNVFNVTQANITGRECHNRYKRSIPSRPDYI